MTGSEPDSPHYAAIGGKVPHRNTLMVKRRRSIRGQRNLAGHGTHRRDTDDLTQIVRVAQAWHEGATLTEIRRAAPFIRGPGNDLAQLVQSERRYLRTRAAETDCTDIGMFLNAHHGSPYTLTKSLLEGEILGEAATAEEIAAMAVLHLPPELGPVVLNA